MAKNIGMADFEQLMQSGKPTVIDFWATWCGPCKRLAPVIEELAQEYEGRVNVVKCDVEEADELAMQFGVTSIPTVAFIGADGEMKNRMVGLQPKSILQAEINKLI